VVFVTTGVILIANNWRWRDGIFLFEELLPETFHKDEVGQEACQAVIVIQYAKVGPDQTAVKGEVFYGPGGQWRQAKGAQMPDGCEHQSLIHLEKPLEKKKQIKATR